MNKVQEKAAVVPEMSKLPEKSTVTQAQETPWLAKTREFLEIKNPAIVKVFVISSVATFVLGIGLAVEWIFHGKSHNGFGWIIYYALFLISLALIIWIVLILMAISCSSRGASQIADSVAAKESSTHVSEAQRTENSESLAIVVDSDEMKNKKDKMPMPMPMPTPRMKRAVSFPSHGRVR